MNLSTTTTLGELIAAFYDEFLKAYKDEEVAKVCTAVLVDRLLTGVSA